ncbi:hypothetical protein HDV01_001289 [Terramyces sp. JEL0728]|nr:hypothetical protein HDV01_001289 [Terramyces sp. JEL0728]
MAISQHLLPIKNHAMEYISSLNQLTTFSAIPALEPQLIDQILLLTQAIPPKPKEAKKFLRTLNSTTVFKKALDNAVVLESIEAMMLNAKSTAYAVDLVSSRFVTAVMPDLEVSNAIFRSMAIRDDVYFN